MFSDSELNKLSTRLENFVIESTKNFDDSHNYQHMKNVVNNSFEIINNDEEIKKKIIIYPQIIKLVLIVAWLHDVRDHKYPDSISEEKFLNFISTIDSENTDIIAKLIINISWSKEAAGLRELFDEPYQTILDIVSDADRIEALGINGIIRTEIFEKKHKNSANVIKHCYDKLLRLLPDGFIKTSHGKILARPLHLEVVNYVESKKN